LHGLAYGATNGLRKFDRRKEACGIEIVFSRFVDDSYLLIPLSVDVMKNFVQLPRFKRETSYPPV